MTRKARRSGWLGHFSLSTNILLGLLLGVLAGLFFGESCRVLAPIGDAFVNLLQMAVLPYVVVSLLAGIGSMSTSHAKLLAGKGGLTMLIFWALTLVVILALPFAFPARESASFFSTHVLSPPKQVDFVSLYIPANPFAALASNLVPAVVVFSIAVGVALIRVERKQGLMESLEAIRDALTRISIYVVNFTPIGVFAITAAAAGSMTLEEFGRLQAYFVTYIVGTLILTFYILPMLVSAVTPLRYRDVIRVCREALLTGFATGNLFIVLPLLVENAKELFREHAQEQGEEAGRMVDILVPISFNFPNPGKLLMLVFVPFGAWLAGSPLGVGQWPLFAGAGLMSFFGSVNVAMPFMLDTLELPADLFQLYLVTGVVNARFATLLAAMGLFCFALVSAALIAGAGSLRLFRLLRWAGTSAAVLVLGVLGSGVALKAAVTTEYDMDKVLRQMQVLRQPVPSVVHLERQPPVQRPPVIDRLRERGTLHVGYMSERHPLSFFNAAGDLVGYDIDMAHRLAADFGVKLEFHPTTVDDVPRDLADGRFDLAMISMAVTPERLEHVTFAASHLDNTFALLVRDHRRGELGDYEQLAKMPNLRIGTPKVQYYEKKLRELLPNAGIVRLPDMRSFLEEPERRLDAFLTTAEMGSAYTLLYPQFTVVIPTDPPLSVPVAYSMARNRAESARAFSSWIELKRKDGTLRQIYDYWILGKGARPPKRRWCIARDVLGWMD